MGKRPKDLPDYKNPPVVEVAMGVQYADDIPGFTGAHSGVFWTELGEEYASAQDAVPIQSTIENFEGGGTLRKIQVSTGLPPARRTQLVHSNGAWVIQIQPDRFLVNWRAEGNDSTYPRFEKCVARFVEYRTRFEAFCKKQGLRIPQLNQCELTYVNHIAHGQGWSSPADVGGIFPDNAWRNTERYLPTPSGLSWNAAFDMPGGDGRLHASVKTGRKRAGNEEVLIYELTARGCPGSASDDAVKDWFRRAREWIVRGFADLAEPDIQENVWGRTS